MHVCLLLDQPFTFFISSCSGLQKAITWNNGMEQSEDEVKISVCITGKIKAVKITLSVLALKILQSSIYNRRKYDALK